MVSYRAFDVTCGLVYVGLVVILQVLVLSHCISFNFSRVQEVYVKVLLRLCHCLEVLNHTWCGNTCNGLIKPCMVFLVSSALTAWPQVCVCPWFVSCRERRFEFGAVHLKHMVIRRFIPEKEPWKAMTEGDVVHGWFPRSAWCLSLVLPLPVQRDDLHRG